MGNGMRKQIKLQYPNYSAYLFARKDSLYEVILYRLVNTYVESYPCTHEPYWTVIHSREVKGNGYDRIQQEAKSIVKNIIENIKDKELITRESISLIDWIRDFSSCRDSEFIDVNRYKVFCENNAQYKHLGKYSEIKASKILKIGGYILVEEEGQNEWLMGEVKKDNAIYCWAYYGSLRDAIQAL